MSRANVLALQISPEEEPDASIDAKVHAILRELSHSLVAVVRDQRPLGWLLSDSSSPNTQTSLNDMQLDGNPSILLRRLESADP